MDLYYVLTSVTARLAHDCQQDLVKDFVAFRIPDRAVVEHVRFQPAVFGLGSDEKRCCDSLGVRTANANYADPAFAHRRGDSRNRVLFVHRKAVSS